MDFLWGLPQEQPKATAPAEVQQKAEQAFSSPTSLASRLGSRNVVSPTGSIGSRRSLRSIKQLSSRRFSKLEDPVLDVIIDSTKVVPSTNQETLVDSSVCSPVDIGLACGSEKADAKTTRSRSLSPPLIKKHIGVSFRRESKGAQTEESNPRRSNSPENLADTAIVALSNADSVIARAADSFRKTFDFISAAHETGKDAAPLSPSTVSTGYSTPPLSPASLPMLSGDNSIQKILAPFKQSSASCDSDDFDPILESRSIMSSSPVPALHLSTSAESSSSSKRTRLSIARRVVDNWQGRSNDADSNEPENCVATQGDSAAASRELALLKLQSSLSHLGSAFTTVAFGSDVNSNRDLPSLMNNSSTALTMDESFDPASLSNEPTAPSDGMKFFGNQSGQASYPGNATVTSREREIRMVRLHDSLSVLPSHAIDSAWMSYCDLPSLLQSQSSTFSFDGAPETISRPVSPPSITENTSFLKRSQHNGTDYVLLARGQSSVNDNMETDIPTEQNLTHQETLSQMQTSLGGIIVFGNDDNHIDKALKAANAAGRTIKPVCASPQLDGRKRRALEPEEQNEFASGDRKRIGLEPEEEHTDFGVDELLMKVENEEITCLTDETYEVVSETKYYSVEVASSGLGIPPCAQATTSEYVTFSDEKVERHIQADFYLEDPLVDVPLVDTLQELRDSPSEREYREKWGAFSYHSSCESEMEETNVYSPSIEAMDGITETPSAVFKGEDPPGKGPWPGICMDPCLSEGAEMSLAASNFVFCHQSPKDLSDSLSASLLEIGSKMQQLDDENSVSKQVSKSVSELGSALTSIWQQTDEAFGVSVATKQVSTALKETAKNPPKPEDFQRRLRELDEEHRIIEQTASAVADGAQYLAQSIESLAVSSTSKPVMLTA